VTHLVALSTQVRHGDSHGIHFISDVSAYSSAEQDAPHVLPDKYVPLRHDVHVVAVPWHVEHDASHSSHTLVVADAKVPSVHAVTHCESCRNESAAHEVHLVGTPSHPSQLGEQLEQVDGVSLNSPSGHDE
jgi:hypothetical protein